MGASTPLKLATASIVSWSLSRNLTEDKPNAFSKASAVENPFTTANRPTKP